MSYKHQYSSKKWMTLTVIVTIMFITGIKCDIRCHCNQPVCVRTGYMCKSKGPQAGCFVEHAGYVNMDRSSDISRHGCIEMLPASDRVSCLELALAMRNAMAHHHHNSHNPHSSIHRGHAASSFRTHNKTITCCLDDMCNYVKTIVDDNNNGNDNSQQSINHNNNDNEDHHRHHHPHRYVHHYRTQSNDNVDSLGRHLQETYGIDDSLQQENSIVVFIILFTIIMCALLCLICCVIRFIRREDNNNNQQRKLIKTKDLHLSSTNTTNIHINRNSILDWRHLKNLSCPGRGVQVFNENKTCKTNPLMNNNIKMKHSHKYLPSFKVDMMDGHYDPSMTKLDDQHDESNLPNIISVHNLPIDYHNHETTFDSLRNNMVYMSPPTAMLAITTPSDTNQPQPLSSKKQSQFDLISNTTSSC